ncbi:MAG: RNA-binding protein [Alphaproteobacteria bacterium]|nr:RNA-binding protein [Alphaproteobacteria bacterium]
MAVGEQDAVRTDARAFRRGDAESPERRCIVTRESAPRNRLVRCVVAPDGTVVPDIEGRLPGRGLWLRAERDIVGVACARNVFSRAARAPVRVADDLADRIEDLLLRRCLDLIGLARRAGEAVTGFEKTRAMVESGRAGALVAAADGAEDGRAKLRAVARGLPLVELFTADELGAAFGRDRAVHAAVAKGGLLDRLLAETGRLAGFRTA